MSGRDRKLELFHTWVSVAVVATLSGCFVSFSEDRLAGGDGGTLSDGAIGSKDSGLVDRHDGAIHDGSVTDASVDAALLTGECAPGAFETGRYSATMIVCRTQAPVTQCEAEATACDVANGWRLCTYGDYGSSSAGTPAKSQPVPGDATRKPWIAGCALNGSFSYAVSHAICQCDGSLSPSVSRDSIWTCDGATTLLTTDEAQSALRVVNTCNRTPWNTASSEGNWELVDRTSTSQSALCCSD